jgi:hypothetical protein
LIEAITEVVDGLWNEQPWMEHAVLALFGALGFPSGKAMPLPASGTVAS